MKPIKTNLLNILVSLIATLGIFIIIIIIETLFCIEFVSSFVIFICLLCLLASYIYCKIQDVNKKPKEIVKTKDWKNVAYPTPPSQLLTDKPIDWCIGTWCNQYVCLPVTRDGVNMIVIGSPGSGKSVFILNVLYTLRYSDCVYVSREDSGKNWNAFICDIKGEIYHKLLPNSELPYVATGTNWIHVIQPSNRSSYGWDVLYRIREEGISTTEKIKAVSDIADALIDQTNTDDAFFTVNAKRLLTGILYYYVDKGWEFIPIIRELTTKPLGELISSVVTQAQKDMNIIVLSKLQSFIGKEENESVGDIEATLKQYLDVFLYPDIVYALDTNNIKTSPAALNDGRTFLDLAIEESMLSTYQPVFRLITMQVLRHCESEFKEEDDRITSIIIDEAARVGKIQDIENSMATLRSKHTNLLLIFQQMQQLQYIYKKDLADTILNLCEIKMWLSCSGDKATVDYLNNIIGDYITERANYKRGNNIISGRTDIKYSEDRQDIITGRTISNLREKNELICIWYGHYIRIHKLYYFKDKYLKKISAYLSEK